MYDREYQGEKINFEASGGLIHSSLVMQDRETDTHWAIISGKAVAGELQGTQLKELPVSEKAKWKDWLKKHPDTLVLSVDGREDASHNPYMDYFASDQGFRGTHAKDKRLQTKQPVFAFHYNGQSFAVPAKDIEGGKSYDLGDAKLFLYRPPGAEIFYSTIAYLTSAAGFKKEEGKWFEIDSNSAFNPETGLFENVKEASPVRFNGFDTFWYNWSLMNPDTKLLN